MNIYLRLREYNGKSDWSVTLRVDLKFQGYGKGYWSICNAGSEPWGLLCLRSGGWFDYDPSNECMSFQCQDAHGSWLECFYLCEAPAQYTDTKHTKGDGVIVCPTNPVGKTLWIDWYRNDQMF